MIAPRIDAVLNMLFRQVKTLLDGDIREIASPLTHLSAPSQDGAQPVYPTGDGTGSALHPDANPWLQVAHRQISRRF